jgi:MFS family permease
MFYASASLSGAFGGLLAFAIIKMDGVGSLHGWRWIFNLEGIATVLLGVISAFILPRDWRSVRGLSGREKEIVGECSRKLL